MACISASVQTPCRAQEVSTAVNDRVGPEAGFVPTVSEKDQRSGGLEIGVIVAGAYEDNIFLSKTKPESDQVVRLGPTVAYATGEEKEGTGGFVRFAYRPTAVGYADHRSDNRVDHDAALTAGWKGKSSKITYTGGIRKLGDATADTGRQTDRIETGNELRVAWIPREKITVELAAGHRSAEYADPTFINSSETYIAAAVRFAYSPKTEVGLAYQTSRLQIDRAGNQTAQQVVATMDWLPREKIHVNLKAGGEQRKTDAGTDIHPVVQGRIDWMPRQNTHFYISGYQREETSASLAGQNYLVRGATAGVSQQLGEKWTARLEGGVESASYSRVAGAGTSGRDDKIRFVRPALEYRFNDECNISLFYRSSNNTSSAPDFGYRQRTLGVELDYQF